MVLKKPYAFLIKNFKKIHILLLLIMLFVVYKTNAVFNFFSNYVISSVGFYESTLAKTYISSFLYIACIFIILLAIVVFVLMKIKEKPTKLYFFIVLTYIFTIILFYIDSGNLRTIVFQQLSPRASRFNRDLNLMAIIPQVILTILVFVRAVGFNIKKFNFSKDIEELQIQVSDNEEFEVTIGTDSGKLGRAVRRNKRELKYFYIENKAMIIGIILTIILAFSGSIYYKINVIDIVYNQNEVVRLNNISYKVEGLYESNLDHRGVKIGEGKHKFLILDLKTYNGNEEERKINMYNMRIVIGDNIYLPTKKEANYFKDIGVGYENFKLKGNGQDRYIFVYKVLTEDLEKDMMLRYADHVVFTRTELITKYIKFNVKSEPIDEFSSFKKADLKSEVYYGLSNIKETKLTINEVDFNDKYTYKNGEKTSQINELMDNMTIMKISYNYKPDPKILGIGTFSELLEEYGTIKYYKDNKSYTLKYKDLTPFKYKENDVYLSVPSEMVNASSIELIFTIRNKIYSHTLK